MSEYRRYGNARTHVDTSSGYVGKFYASFVELVQLFGEPRVDYHRHKILADWYIHSPTRRIFCVYDYKSNCTLEQLKEMPRVEWHVDALSKVQFIDFISYLSDKFNRVIESVP